MHMGKTLELPPPIERYLRSVNTGDQEGFASSFAGDAFVEDVSRKIRGLDAIRKWARHDIFDVDARFDVVKVTESGGQTVVTVKIDGTFSRKGLPDPLLMNHAFRIGKGKITELKIGFVSDS